MAISVWKPGTLYQPQEVVVPQSAVQPGSVPPTNPGFESGDSDWTKGTGWAINNTEAFAGSYSAQHSSAGSDLAIVNNLKAEVTPGQSVTARCLVKSSAADTDANITIGLRWYTSGDVFVSDSMGNAVSGSDGWKDSKVTATCPGTAAKVSVIAVADNPNGVTIRADAFSWNHVNPNEAQALAFKNTNTTAGLSGATEPTWPSTVGGTVVDNEVTWEAFAARTVTWQASANLVSGATEPTWPIEGGAYVSDGTIAWKAIPYRIEDENCPNTKVVAIAASKIFSGDDDVMRFSATLNPRDWSTAQDAGFLPTGLQQRGQIGIEGAGNYRGNLCVWSASTFQMWQVDPDPANMALLDTIEGIGTTYYKAIQPVSNELFFCAALGVRTVGLAAGSGSLQAGDVGLPVDSMIQPAVFGKQPISTYYPSAGQYWITTSNEDPVPVDPPLLMACGVLAPEYEDGVYSYTPTVTNASGVDLTFTLTGDLPDGLAHDEVTGEISGTITENGTFNFTQQVSAEGYTSAECIYSLVVNLCGTGGGNVVSLLNGNGVDASTTFTDEMGLTWVKSTPDPGHTNQTQISTTQAKYGTASIRAGYSQTYDGIAGNNGLYGIETDGSPFELSGVGDWAIDMWVFPVTPTGVEVRRVCGLFSRRSGFDVGFCPLSVTLGTLGQIGVKYSSDNAAWDEVLVSVGNLTFDAWNFVRIQCRCNKVYVYINGVQDQWSTGGPGFDYFETTAGWTSSSNKAYVGVDSDSTTAGGDNTTYIDDFRFTINGCITTGNFTPPSAELTTTVPP